MDKEKNTELLFWNSSETWILSTKAKIAKRLVVHIEMFYKFILVFFD